MDIIDLWHSILLWLIFNWCPPPPSPSERKITEAVLIRFSTAKELLFFAFLLSSFFLLDFDTLVLEPIK